jgi:hypothetical protein
MVAALDGAGRGHTYRRLIRIEPIALEVAGARQPDPAISRRLHRRRRQP